MRTKLFGCLVFVMLVCVGDGAHNKRKTKRKVAGGGEGNGVHFRNLTEKHGAESRGFLPHGKLQDEIYGTNFRSSEHHHSIRRCPTVNQTVVEKSIG